jgi:Ni/Fe-hydrogenase 1 B-type cytochrome subunit
VEKIIPKREWSAAVRLNHWLTAVCIFFLIGTGLYIADPFTISKGETVGKMFMGDVRFWHILFGMSIGLLFVWRFYLSFFTTFYPDWKDFLAWTDWKNLNRQVRFYLLLSKEPPEHNHLYDPLQALAYAAYLAMLFLLVLTGTIMMGAGYGTGITALVYKVVKPVENWMGGLAMVRWIHHILMWGVILFMAVHINMALLHDYLFKEGTVSSMISGTVFHRSHK